MHLGYAERLWFRAIFAGERMDMAWRATTLRWAVVHMIEETARHLGHMDITRELIDGRTGR